MSEQADALHALIQEGEQAFMDGELDLAILTFDRIRELRPDEPQSHRDLALALAHLFPGIVPLPPSGVFLIRHLPVARSLVEHADEGLVGEDVDRLVLEGEGQRPGVTLPVGSIRVEPEEGLGLVAPARTGGDGCAALATGVPEPSHAWRQGRDELVVHAACSVRSRRVCLSSGERRLKYSE